MPRSASEVQAELDIWYAARIAAANGSSLTISTSAGSRTVTTQDLEDINETISRLERELDAIASGRRHNFAVCNFNTTETNSR